MTSVAGIVLAAGASRRLGTAKQLVRLGSETLLERIVRVALEADLNPVLVVVSADLVIDPVPVGVIIVTNYDAAEGIASSIRIGLRELTTHGESASGVVLMACDQPSVTASHLRELASGAEDIVASTYSGGRGIPAYFPAAVFKVLMSLAGDMGARGLLRNVVAIPLPLGELDIDTTEDLKNAQKLYER